MNLPGDMDEPYGQFYEAVNENRVFDEKTTGLLKLASAMAIGCRP